MEQVEALCEWICLLHDGRPVLNGRLRDIKAAHGRNAIAVEYDGDTGRLDGIAGVRECTDTGHEARLQLEADADAQQVMRALLDRVVVRGVRLDEPRIEEIYEEKVGHA